MNHKTEVNKVGTTMRKVIIETIPHNKQRYKTCGDWFENGDNTLRIKVSSLFNYRYEYLIAIHELIEALLCHERGIAEGDVTKFDEQFEEFRPPLNTDEPGDHPLAPYKREHFFATSIERLVASELGVDWIKYEEAINKLS